jgi:hypothetical protein
VISSHIGICMQIESDNSFFFTLSILRSIDYMVGPDRHLSEAEFKALVHKLTSSLDYLDHIWRGTGGDATTDDQFRTYRKGTEFCV